MKKLILFLISIVAFAAPTISNVQIGPYPGHDSFLVTWDTSSTFTDWRLYYSIAPGTCNSSGKFTPSTGSIVASTTTMGAFFTGQPTGQTYNVCPAVTDDGWTTMSNLIPISISTAISNPHPFPPIPPFTFDVSMPDLTGATTVHSSCTNLNNDIAAQLPDVGRLTHVIIIDLPQGTTCLPSQPAAPGITDGQIETYGQSPDIINFHATDVTTGSPGTIQFAHNQFTEGQLISITRPNTYIVGYPSSNSCDYGTGMWDGEKYFVHIQSDDGVHQLINLRCWGNQALFSFTSSATDSGPGFWVIPFYLTNGNCPSASGTSPCHYWDRHLKELIIRTSAPDSELPPPGSRLTPDYENKGILVKFQNAISHAGGGSIANQLIQFGDNDTGHNYGVGKIRFIGIQFTNEIDTSADPVQYCVMFNTNKPSSNIIFDRVIFDGNDSPQKWGGRSCGNAFFMGTNIAMINSSGINIKTPWPSSSSDTAGDASQFIVNAPGPVLFYNNYFTCAGICIHQDDGDGYFFGVHGDTSQIRNYFDIPEKWQFNNPNSDGFKYFHRQDTEIKAGFRSVYIGNIYDHNYKLVTNAGVAGALTSVGDAIGIRDVLFHSNTLLHGPGGMSNLLINTGKGVLGAPPIRMEFSNNLSIDINGSWSENNDGVGWSFQGPAGGEDFVIKNNTWVQNHGNSPAFLWLENYPIEGLDIENNVMWLTSDTGGGGNGFRQEGALLAGNPNCTTVRGEDALKCLASTNLVFKNNILLGMDSDQATITGWFPSYASLNFIPSNMSPIVNPGWAKYDLTGGTGVWNLTAASAYNSKNIGLPKDEGVDYWQLLRDQGYVKFDNVTNITSTTATVPFTAPDSQSCPVDISTDPLPNDHNLRFADSGTNQGARSVSLSGLTASTYYYGRIMCAVSHPDFGFKTN